MSNKGVPFAFDATQFDPATGSGDVIPTGEYKLAITSSELKKTNSGGQMIMLGMRVLEGEQKDKVIFENINVQNSNATAVEIGQKTLSAISHVTGVLTFQTTAQLHGKPFMARVEQTTYKNDKGDDLPTNNIKAYMDINGNAPVRGQAPQAGQPAPAVAAAPVAQPQAAPAPQPAAAAPAMSGAPQIQGQAQAPAPQPAPAAQPGAWGGNAPAPAPAPAPVAGFANPAVAPQQ